MHQSERNPEQVAQYLAALQAQESQTVHREGLILPLTYKQRATTVSPERDWKEHWKAQGQPWRREPEIDLRRQQFLRERYTHAGSKDEEAPLQGVDVTRADIEWLLVHRGEFASGQKGLNLCQAIMKGTSFANLSLEKANFREAKLERADFSFAKLERANFREAKLEEADFREAKLEGAYFSFAKLEGAYFNEAKLEGANFSKAKLERADFSKAKLEGANFSEATLGEAYFRRAKLEGADFGEVTLGNRRGVGPWLADVQGWDGVNLAVIDWFQIRWLGEEVEAHKKKQDGGRRKGKVIRVEEYHRAARGYRQLATALEGQGLKEEAEHFAYRAQVMQRIMLWHRIWRWEQRPEEKQQTPFRQRVGAWRRRLGQGWTDLWACFFLLFLSVLTGYGYRLGRALFWYVVVLVAFMGLYLWISCGQPLPSTWDDVVKACSWLVSSQPRPLGRLDALIMSVSNMVGRGFFSQANQSLAEDPYAGWSVVEGVIGVFMDVLLISTLTQRLFKK